MTDYLTDAKNDIKTYLDTHPIPTYFYRCFLGELVKIWGVLPLFPDDDYSRTEPTIWFLDGVSGTGGWCKAFEAACSECGIMDIHDDYSKMDWVHSGIFNEYICEKMLNVIFTNTPQ